MEKKNKIIAGIIALLAIIAGFFAVTVPDWNGKNETAGSNNTVGSISVSEEPIPLILINYNQKGGSPDSFGRIQNFANPANKALITQGVKGEDWEIYTTEINYSGEIKNVTVLGILRDLTTTMQVPQYFPKRLDIALYYGIYAVGGQPALGLTFGKSPFIDISFDLTSLLQKNPEGFVITLNTTDGEVVIDDIVENINISPTDVFAAYMNLVVDEKTGDIIIGMAPYDNCSKYHRVYEKNIGPFKFVSDSTGNITTEISVSGVSIGQLFLGVFQNPLTGQYESLNIEYCNPFNRKPLQ